MSKFNLLTTLSLNASGLSEGLKKSIKDVENYVNSTEGQNSKLSYSFRDVTEMGVGEMRKELMKLRNISFAGKTQEEISIINQRIGELTDTMGDLKAQQKALGSEFSSVVAGGLQTAAAFGEIAVGAASMFGASKEQAEKYQRAMVNLIGVSQAAATIQNAIDTKQIQVIGLKVKALYQQTAATVQATVAQTGLNTAMSASVIGASIVAVAALTAGLYLLAEAQTSETETQKNARLERLANLELEKEASRLAADELAQMSLLKAALTNKTRSSGEYRIALKELDKQLDTNLSSEKDINTAIDKGLILIDKKIKLIGVEAKAQAAKNILIKDTEALLNAQAEYEAADAERRLGGIKAVEKAEEAYDNVIQAQERYNISLAKSIQLSGEANKVLSDLNLFLPKDPTKKEEKKESDKVGKEIKIPLDITLPNTDDNEKQILALAEELIKGIEADLKPIELKLAPIPQDSMNGVLEQVGALSGSLTSFFDQQSGEYKAFATVQALISTYLAAVQVMANQAKLGPIAMGIAFAGTIATGLAAVAKIQGFAEGGIVAGQSFTGDRVLARVNSKEMILTQRQQAQLFNMANGAGYSAGSQEVVFRIEDSTLVGVLNRYNKRVKSMTGR